MRQFPQAHSVYEFRCRNETTVYPPADIREDFEHGLEALCMLHFQDDELDYLRRLRFIEGDFVDYLELFQLKRRFVTHWSDERGRLNIQAGGPTIQVMFFEIYTLSIVSGLYFRHLEAPEVVVEGERRLQERTGRLKELAVQQNPADPPFLISDFDTHHHYNLVWQKCIIRTLLEAAPDIVHSTSNAYLTKELDITPISTMAHKFLQTFQALDSRLRDFQRTALKGWVHKYRSDLGIALTGMVGMDAFLCDFDLYLAKLFDGLCHDSGDPYERGDKAYARYRKPEIDSHTKMLTFLDGPDIEHPWALHQYFKDRFKTSFGIGTNLTNDTGYVPLNIALKPVECDSQLAAKLPDTLGKIVTINNTFLAYLRRVFEIPRPKPEDGR